MNVIKPCLVHFGNFTKLVLMFVREEKLSLNVKVFIKQYYRDFGPYTIPM